MIAKNSCDNKFYRLTTETVTNIIELNLSKKAIELYYYYLTLNPFGDIRVNFSELSKQFQKQFNWNAQQFNRAKRELSKHSLIVFNYTRECLGSNIPPQGIQKMNPPIQNLIPTNSENDPPKMNNIPPQGIQKMNSTVQKMNSTIQNLIPNSSKNDISHTFKINDSNGSSISQTNQTINTNQINQISEREEKKFDDERLMIDDFLKYCQYKLPKAKNLERYLMTKDKTTGDRILERLWLEYEQWKNEGNLQAQSNGNKYLDDLVNGYRNLPPQERFEFNWSKINWRDNLTTYEKWLKRAKGSCETTFIEDNHLGYTKNLRTIFFRWYSNYFELQDQLPINEQAKNLIDGFLDEF